MKQRSFGRRRTRTIDADAVVPWSTHHKHVASFHAGRDGGRHIAHHDDEGNLHVFYVPEEELEGGPPLEGAGDATVPRGHRIGIDGTQPTAATVPRGYSSAARYEEAVRSELARANVPTSPPIWRSQGPQSVAGHLSAGEGRREPKDPEEHRGEQYGPPHTLRDVNTFMHRHYGRGGHH
jgi:hypothetical protein